MSIFSGLFKSRDKPENRTPFLLQDQFHQFLGRRTHVLESLSERHYCETHALFVLVFPPQDEEDKYSILPYFWVPEETLDLRVKRDHVPYDSSSDAP